MIDIKDYAQYFFVSLTGIFVIVNPITTAFAFMALTGNFTKAEKKDAARKGSIMATFILFLFALAGSIIFQLFGITLYSFRIAGGIILFGIAMGMLGRKDEHQGIAETADTKHDISLIPIAIPFISGPGSIATVMITVSEAHSIYHSLLIYLAIIITTATCYFLMIYAHRVTKYIGDTGRLLVIRLFGLILSVVAVQFVMDGIIELYQEQFMK